jgi:hypothetical protein
MFLDSPEQTAGSRQIMPMGCESQLFVRFEAPIAFLWVVTQYSLQVVTRVSEEHAAFTLVVGVCNALDKMLVHDIGCYVVARQLLMN